MPYLKQAARLLVVDDDAIFNQLFVYALNHLGYEAEGVHSSDAAVEALARRHFDLVFADVHMPGNRQLQLLRTVVDHHPLLPVVLMTGYPEMNTVIEALRAGAADFFVKPSDTEDVESKIRRLLTAADRRRRARRALDELSTMGEPTTDA